MTEIADLTASEAARRIAAGSLTASALAEACLARITAREPEVRAFAWLDPALVRRGAAGTSRQEFLRIQWMNSRVAAL